MEYQLNEVFHSIQGEGFDMGKPVIFVRMAGCNKSCHFCDTDFSRKMTLNETDLFKMIQGFHCRYVVFTGGEPMLQDLVPIRDILDQEGYRCGIETNGTIDFDTDVWGQVSLSPKQSRILTSLTDCDSLKILYPYQPGMPTAEEFHHFPCHWRGIQPIDCQDKELNKLNIAGAIEEVSRLGNGWRLSVQVHKLINLK